MTEPCVFIVDDDPAVRDALCTLIDSVGIRTRCYADADSFLHEYADQPGCLISDICLPGTDGVQLLDILRKRAFELPLIAISAHGDIPLAVGMLRRGAVDFIEKPFRNHLVLQRVQEALHLDAAQRRQAMQQETLRRRMDNLTPRETEVLALLIEGLSNKLIARQLALSPRTVETHRANILRKMEVESVTALARGMASLSS